MSKDRENSESDEPNDSTPEDSIPRDSTMGWREREQIDEICERYETQRRSGDDVRIEDFVAEVSERMRPYLLEELAIREWELRAANGDTPTIEEFEKRFPEQQDVLAALKQRFKTASDHEEFADMTTDLALPNDASKKPANKYSIEETVELDASLASKHSPQERVGPYTIIRPIGAGGMGQVFLAEQSEPVKRQVALKVVKSDAPTQEILRRFEAERQAVAMMDHPNIAKVYDAGVTAEGRPYFAMELVAGTPITEFCDENDVRLEARLDLFSQTCRAVQHAHQKGIIHRDLKPGNVLVTKSDGKLIAKVIDFGLAKAIQEGVQLTEGTMFTQIGQIVGTLAYMSPEQADSRTKDIDTRTDVYSLGVILYELLTGSTPITRDKMQNEALDRILAMVREEEPTRPSSRLGESGDAVSSISSKRQLEPNRLSRILKGDLDWIAMKALEKERARRYESPGELADDIQRFLLHEAIEARPPSFSYRLRKAYGRHRFAFLAGASILATLIVGLASTFVMWRRAVGSESRAKTEASRATKAEEIALIEAGNARSAEADAVLEAENAVRARVQTEKAKAKTEAALSRSNFFLATARLEADRPIEAANLLDRIPQQFRHIEWRMARHQAGSGAVYGYGHTSPIRSVAMLRDGSQVFTASDDGTIKRWEASTGKELQTIVGHKGRVLAICLSPDEKWLASASEDRTIRIWNTGNGEFYKALVGHDAMVACVRYSPDGTQIATGSFDKTIRLWDVEKGETIQRFIGHKSTIESLCFSPNGKLIVSGGGRPLRNGVVETVVHMWDASNGELLTTNDRGVGHLAPVISVSFSKAGNEFASADTNGKIIFWSVQDREFQRNWLVSDVAINSIHYGGDDEFFTSASDDGSVVLWEFEGQPIKTFHGHRGAVHDVDTTEEAVYVASAGADGVLSVWPSTTQNSAQRIEVSSKVISSQTPEKQIIDNGRASAINPNGTQIVVGFTGGQIRLIDANTEEPIWTMNGHEQQIDALCFSRDGKKIVSGSRDLSAKVWDTQNGDELVSFEEHTEPITEIAMSVDGQMVATASGNDGVVYLWDANDGSIIQKLKRGSGTGRKLCFSTNGSRLAAGDVNRVLVWSTKNGSVLHSLAGHRNSVTDVAFNAAGDKLISTSDDKTLHLWDLASGRKLQTFSGHIDRVKSVCFHVSGERIVSGDKLGKIKIWDVSTGAELYGFDSDFEAEVKQIGFDSNGSRLVTTTVDNVQFWEIPTSFACRSLNGHTNQIYNLEFSPDGSMIASASVDRSVRLWDVATGEVRNILDGHNQVAYCANFHPDGKQVATASGDNTIKLWNVANGELQKTLKGHTAAVYRVRYSPNGERLASVSEDKTLRIWNVSDGTVERTIDGHLQRVTGVGFRPDGSQIVTGSYDQTAIIWDVETGEKVRVLDGGHETGIRSVSFSNDGNRIYTRSTDARCVWDAQTGERLEDAKWQGTEPRLATSPQGGKVAVTSNDRILLIDRRESL